MFLFVIFGLLFLFCLNFHSLRDSQLIKWRACQWFVPWNWNCLKTSSLMLAHWNCLEYHYFTSKVSSLTFREKSFLSTSRVWETVSSPRQDIVSLKYSNILSFLFYYFYLQQEVFVHFNHPFTLPEPSLWKLWKTREPSQWNHNIKWS